ncbi:hypothetical protein CALCODRAFT_278304 [Calocera cornea HHB12733]|uniref:Uncharacterized protein n=1 Tax=Calocera cornea HHB12733 TaxID=1353952 RepID=A0A165JQD3_9BASI|nr:hypothetical protein CALCODRAFT_278304 [Calocera cornea HHB12733]
MDACGSSTHYACLGPPQPAEQFGSVCESSTPVLAERNKQRASDTPTAHSCPADDRATRRKCIRGVQPGFGLASPERSRAAAPITLLRASSRPCTPCPPFPGRPQRPRSCPKTAAVIQARPCPRAVSACRSERRAPAPARPRTRAASGRSTVYAKEVPPVTSHFGLPPGLQILPYRQPFPAHRLTTNSDPLSLISDGHCARLTTNFCSAGDWNCIRQRP